MKALCNAFPKLTEIITRHQFNLQTVQFFSEQAEGNRRKCFVVLLENILVTAKEISRGNIRLCTEPTRIVFKGYNIYIYIYIYKLLEKKTTNKLQVHPDKPVS